MARPVPLKDHITHVFMLYQLCHDEFLVGKLKRTTGYTMMVMMDVGSISSMLSSYQFMSCLVSFLPSYPQRKGENPRFQKKSATKNETPRQSHLNLKVSRIPVIFGCFKPEKPPKKTGNWICSGTLDMPPYSDFETCRHKMTQMLRLGRAHFDEGAGQLSIVRAIWREGLTIQYIVSKMFFF